MWPGSSAPRMDGTASSPSRSDGPSRSPAAAAFAAAAAHARTNALGRPSPALASAALPVKAPGFVPASPPQVVTAPPMTPIKKKKKKTIAIIDNVDSSANGAYYSSSPPPGPSSSSDSFAPYSFAYPSIPASSSLPSSCPAPSPSISSNVSSSALSSVRSPSISSSNITRVSQPSSLNSNGPQHTASAPASSSISFSPHSSITPSPSYPTPSLASQPPSSLPSPSLPILPPAATLPSPSIPTPVPIQSNVLTPPTLLVNSLSNSEIVQIPAQVATASTAPTPDISLPADHSTMCNDSPQNRTDEGTMATSPTLSPAGASTLTSSSTFQAASHSSPTPPEPLPSEYPTSSADIPLTSTPTPDLANSSSSSISVPVAVTPVQTQLQPPHVSVVPPPQISGNHTHAIPTLSNDVIQTLPSPSVSNQIPTPTIDNQQSTQPAMLSSESHDHGATTTPSSSTQTTSPLSQIQTTTTVASHQSASSVAIILSPPPVTSQSTISCAPLSSSSATSTGISSPLNHSVLPLTLSPSASNSALITQPYSPAPSYSPASVPLNAVAPRSPAIHSLPNKALLSPVISPQNSSASTPTSPSAKPLPSPSTLAVASVNSSTLSPVSSTNSLSSPVSVHIPPSSPNSSQMSASPVSDSSSKSLQLQVESSNSKRESSGGDYSKHLPEKTPMVSGFVLREALGQKDRIIAEKEEQYAAKLQAAQRKHQDELQELTTKMSNLVQTHVKRGQSLQTELQKEQEETRKLRLALSKEQAQRETEEQASAQRLKDLTQQLHLLKSQLLGENPKTPVAEDAQKKIARMTNQLMVAETEVLEARDELEASAKELRRVREIVLEERELRGQLEQQLEQIKSLFEQESKQLQLRTSALQEKDAAIDRLQKYLKELELECQGALKSASNLSARVTKDKEFAIMERDRYFAQVQKLELSLQKQAERFEQESKRVTKAYEESLAKQLATADKLLLKKAKAWRAETEATREKQEATLLELKKAVEIERAQSTQLLAQQEDTIATLSAKLAKLSCRGDVQALISQNALIAEVELKALDEELHAVKHGPTFLRGEALRAELKEQQEELGLKYQALETDQETQTAMQAEVVNIQSQMDHIRDNKGRDLVLESVVALNQMQEQLEEKIRQKEAEVERLRLRVSELEASCKRQAELEEAEAAQMQRRTGFLQRSRECIVREQRLWQIVNQHGVVAGEDAGEEHILKVLEVLLGLSTLRFQVLAERREYDFDRERKIDADEEARRIQYEGGLLELREMLAKAHNGKQKLAMQSASTIEELKRMLTSVEAQLEHNRAQQDKGKWWNFHFRDKKKD